MEYYKTGDLKLERKTRGTGEEGRQSEKEKT
jgi:hypothetical protein